MISMTGYNFNQLIMGKIIKVSDDLPNIPEEIPVPEKQPEVRPPAVPESPVIPEKEPDIIKEPQPFQPDIPTEVPPALW